MKLLRNLLTIFVVLATLGMGVLFALQNKTAVPLDLLVYTLGPQSLALWVLGAFALGGVLGDHVTDFVGEDRCCGSQSGQPLTFQQCLA